jgi:prepilin-type N-terminal cleavage/methylation domain-containing protein
MQRNSGFTLIELSIVLVIIGLIVGGVLVGKDLIKAAGIRSTLSQVEKINTAINTFRLKYNCLPGDCANAVSYGVGTAGNLGNGDGNRLVHSHIFMTAVNQGITMKESFNLYYHLMQARLIEGIFLGYDGFVSFDGEFTGHLPQCPLTKDCFVSAFSITDTSSGWGDYPLGNSLLLHGKELSNPGYFWGLTAMEAYTIDLKLDDGNPLTGNVRTNNAYAGPMINASWNGCMRGDGTPRYDIEGQYLNYGASQVNNPPNPGQRGCSIGIKGSW